jgi:hypothetical protein
VVFDTPGLLDTKGKSNEEILLQIEAAYLRLHQDHPLDGLILVMNPSMTRNWLKFNLASYVELFSDSLLKSLVIVINRREGKEYQSFANSTKDKITEFVANSRWTSVTVPIVVVNCLHPTLQEIDGLTKALAGVQPYQIKDFEEKKKKIEAIYQELLKDPESYMTEIRKVIQEEQRTFKSQGLQRVVERIPVKKYLGCRFSVDLGVFSYCSGGNTVTEMAQVAVDHVVDLEKTQTVPVAVDEATQVLKNQEEYYWKLAVKKYQEIIQSQFVKSPI